MATFGPTARSRFTARPPPVVAAAGRGASGKDKTVYNFPLDKTLLKPITSSLIKDLQPHLSNTLVIGLVINKQSIHSFPDKKNPGSYRYRLTFTLRDSPTDYINVTCWGSETFINSIDQSFKLYDIIEVCDCQVSTKPFNEGEDKWAPWTPSSFQLTVNESFSSVRLSSQITGEEREHYLSLAHVPLRPHSDYYMLNDVINNGRSLEGSYINILAVVGSVSTPKQVMSKTGKSLTKCEVVLFDERCNRFHLLIWDSELISLAQTWISKENIIFAVDIKVAFDSFRNTMNGSCTSKTLITTNPDSPQAHYLYQYAQTAQINFQDHNEESITNIDIHTIKDYFTVEQLIQLREGRGGNDYGMLPANAGILFAYLTSLDIDKDPQTLVNSRCSICKFRVSPPGSRSCCNQSCSSITSGHFIPELVIDLFVTLADHTGSVDSIRLNGQGANELLHTTPSDFLHTEEQQRIDLKSSLLLEKYKFYFKCNSFGGKTFVHILSVERASPQEIVNMLSY